MSLLITPNGFPLFCSKVEYENVAREVRRVLDNADGTVGLTFERQLDILTVFVWALETTGSFFKPIVKYPNMAISPTVTSFLTSMATDLDRTSKPARNVILWPSLFALEDNPDQHRPVSVSALKLIRDASVYTPHLIVTQLSKVLSASEMVDMMGILFGDHTGS